MEMILVAAKLIAPRLDKSWVVGYDWVIEALKQDHPHLASEMEIMKATEYLNAKQFEQAIDLLKTFEKKETDMKAKAATNLAFLYFLEGKIEDADRYAEMALKADRYNAKALVNKGNIWLYRGELQKADELFLEAIGVEAGSCEAIYNHGITCKRMGGAQGVMDALKAFEKLSTMLPKSPEVLYQIADCHDRLGNFRQAIESFTRLLATVPSDAGVLAKVGQLHNKSDDEQQAFDNYLQSYRYLPVNLDVISWLGVWFVKQELYEKAIQFFERASQIQPAEVKWRLMVTSCYRRMGSYPKALELYEEIHRDYPDNLECLRYLVAICKELSMPSDKYEAELKKMEHEFARKAQSAGGGGALTQFGGGGAAGGTAAGGGGGGGGDSRSGAAPSGALRGGGAAPGMQPQRAIMEEDEEEARPAARAPMAHSQEARVARAQQDKPPDDSVDFEDADVGNMLPDD
jgi:intraflagellar transport protein 88